MSLIRLPIANPSAGRRQQLRRSSSYCSLRLHAESSNGSAECTVQATVAHFRRESMSAWPWYCDLPGLRPVHGFSIVLPENGLHLPRSSEPSGPWSDVAQPVAIAPGLQGMATATRLRKALRAAWGQVWSGISAWI